MKSRLIIAIVISVFILPFISLAQIRYAFDTFLSQAEGKLFLLFLMAFPLFLYIYKNRKIINNELDQKYQLLGSKGGKVKRRKQLNNETLK